MWPWLGAALGTTPAIANELIHFLRLSETAALNNLSNKPISNETDKRIQKTLKALEKSARSSPMLLICGSVIGAIGGVYCSRVQSGIENVQHQGVVSLSDNIDVKHGATPKQ
tara:strand:- start:69 stop:404 length:336 start_codon:yes stop_codon:yes gene_type:complete